MIPPVRSLGVSHPPVVVLIVVEDTIEFTRGMSASTVTENWVQRRTSALKPTASSVFRDRALAPAMERNLHWIYSSTDEARMPSRAVK